MLMSASCCSHTLDRRIARGGGRAARRMPDRQMRIPVDIHNYYGRTLHGYTNCLF